MTIIYKYVSYKFNTTLFANDCLNGRQRLGATQQEISDCIDMQSANGYGRIERGGLPTIQTFYDLCNLFGLRPSLYVDETTE